MNRWLVMGGAVLAVVLIIVGVKACGVVAMMNAGNQGEPKATVTSMKAGYQDWQSGLSAVGSLHSVRGADLSAEVAGIVDAIKFNSGETAKAGDLLVQLRADSDVAGLRALQAQAELARANFARAKAQNELRLISKSDFDAAAANLHSTQAQVEAQAALVAKKAVHAPFDGELGIIQVNVGQYVNAGDKIVTLQTLDPIYVDFSLPQQSLSQLAAGQPVNATADSFPGQIFTGQVTAIDPKVDLDTRNVQVRATLQNSQRKLLPGMFANVAVDVGQPQRYLTLPQTAVTYNPYGETVFVIVPRGQENQPDPNAPPEARQAQQPAAPGKPAEGDTTPVARQLFITVGPKRGDQVAVLKGLKEGDEVVTSGQLKLRNGAAVTIDNKVQPSNDSNPAPQEQ